MTSSSDSTNSDFLKHLPLFVTGALALGIGISYAAIPDFRQFLSEAFTVLTSDDEQRITKWVSQFGWLGPLLLVFAMIAQIFMIVIPSWALMVVAVLAYGPVWGTLLSLLSVVIAAAVAYSVGKYVGNVAVKKLVGDKTEEKIENWVKEHGFWAVVLARVSPIVSGDAISLVSGLTEMKFFQFITATLVGVTPLAVAIGFFGENTSRLKEGFIWLSVASGLIFVGYLLYQRKRKKGRTEARP
ncbi:TVP38/TMEM64 family protein [Tellurirhabdus bombi]|uniref:TVP38/TMEM64 family protein n=1 Tax=Tellurirhabdus bombi TaxID=2907205 RepID=UPI001F3A98D2|nr:TVP38/TMEM64 family protein [Tellurirhabdus bombi]